MDEQTFIALSRRAGQLTGDYGSGYQRGLRRLYHGARFGTPDEHAKWMRLGLDGDYRDELGRGYRDGFAGVEPQPLRGRPPAAPDSARTARFELRLTPGQRDKLERLGGSEWLRDRIDRAREPEGAG